MSEFRYVKLVGGTFDGETQNVQVGTDRLRLMDKENGKILTYRAGADHDHTFYLTEMKTVEIR